jgi:hypothetical protein
MKEYDNHIDESHGKMERHHDADDYQNTNEHTLPPFAWNYHGNTMKSANGKCHPHKSRNNSEVDYQEYYWPHIAMRLEGWEVFTQLKIEN